MIIAIVKDLYAVLENKKCKSTELGTLIWSDQSSEVLDACQLLITGKKKKKKTLLSILILPTFPILYRLIHATDSNSGHRLSLDNYAWIFLNIGITILLKNINYTRRHMMSTAHHYFLGQSRMGTLLLIPKFTILGKKKLDWNNWKSLIFPTKLC